jgi:hypothetical protein
MQNKNITTNKSKVCFGITNLAKGGYSIPFFDYDTVDIENIILELKQLQEYYNLSDIYIFNSNHGYNALSLDKIEFNLLKEIYETTEFVCKDFIKFGIKRNFLTLRIGNDKKLLTVLERISTREKSFAHALALNYFYNIDIKNKIGFDDNSILRIKAYRSEKDGYLEVKHL